MSDYTHMTAAQAAELDRISSDVQDFIVARSKNLPGFRYIATLGMDGSAGLHTVTNFPRVAVPIILAGLARSTAQNVSRVEDRTDLTNGTRQ